MQALYPLLPSIFPPTMTLFYNMMLAHGARPMDCQVGR